MPLHGVGLIVGGTIAVIGSGYAFKKFIYDPHLAHYVEAFIAQHNLLPNLNPATPSPARQDARRGTPIPVPATTSATSSARQPNLTNLRRRRSTRDRDVEGIEMELEITRPLLWSGGRDEYCLDSDDLDDWGKIRRETIQVSASDRMAQRPLPALPLGVAHVTDTSIAHNLVDLNHDLVQHAEHDIPSQAYEIRSIIFDRDERSSSPLPSLPTENASISETVSQAPVPYTPSGMADPASLANSISSITARSRPAALSDSWSISALGLDPTEGTNPFSDSVVVRPETAQSVYSDYIDAETYSPNDDRAASPMLAFPYTTAPIPQHTNSSATPLTTEAVARHDGGMAVELGMSYIRLHTPAIPEIVANGEVGPGPKRGPMSVVSLSESEGARSDAEWEAI